LRRFMVLGAIASIFSVGAVQAQAPSGPLPPEQIIVIRQAVMDLQQGVAGAMKAAVDAKSDVKPLVPGAKGLVSSAKVITSMFPGGTETGHDTKAKPEIWSDWAGFEKAQAAMLAATEKLVPLAEANDTAGFATQFAAVGRTCGGCHREYKMKD